jgi:hypothetical protein
MYSDIDSVDLSVYSSIGLEGLDVELQLEHGGEVLDTITVRIDNISAGSNIVKVFEWDTDSKEDGKYTVRSRITQGECGLYSGNHSFVHGRQVIPRININNLAANSEGASILIAPVQPAIMDIEFMLVDGPDVIYSATQQKVSLHTQPGITEHTWNTLLTDGKDYRARVKINMYTPSESLVLMERFTAREDVFISDTYRDAIGASATIEGRSQVPFTGSVRFTVADRFGTVIESVSERSPVLLNGDDETVETIWENRLPEGSYKLTMEVLGGDGTILDRRETIIEAAAARRVTTAGNNTTENESSQAPGFLGAHLLSAVAAVVLFLRMRSR